MLEDILKGINKDFKKELAVKGIGEFKIKRIPFTSPRLNYETYGGIPRGRISMFAGKESSGKSTTALDIVKNAQILFKKEYNEEKCDLFYSSRHDVGFVQHVGEDFVFSGHSGEPS